MSTNPSTTTALSLWRLCRAQYHRYAMGEFRSLVEETLRQVRHNAAAEPVSSLRDLLPSLHPEFQIMVMGTFSSGKSTFLNAVAGRELLPSARIRCTRALALIRYADPDEGRHCQPDGVVERLSLEEALRRIDETNRSEGERQDWFELAVNAPLLDGLAFGDCPGFDDESRLDHRYCLHQLGRADGIVWLVMAGKVGRKADLDLLTVIPHETPVLGVLTKRDKLHTSLDGPLAEAREHFGQRVDHWLSVDSKGALRSQLAGDPAGVAASGLPEVLDRIRVLLGAEGGRSKLVAKYTHLRRLLDEAEGRLSARHQVVLDALARREAARAAVVAQAGRSLHQAARVLAQEVGERVQAVRERFDSHRAVLLEQRLEPGFSFRAKVLEWTQLAESAIPMTIAQGSLEAARRALASCAGEKAGRPLQLTPLAWCAEATWDAILVAASHGDEDDSASGDPGRELLVTLSAGEAGPRRGTETARPELEPAGDLDAIGLLHGVKLEWGTKKQGFEGFLQDVGRLVANKVGHAAGQYDAQVRDVACANLRAELDRQVGDYLVQIVRLVGAHVDAAHAALDSELLAEWDGLRAAARERNVLASQLRQLTRLRHQACSRLQLAVFLKQVAGSRDQGEYHHG